MSPKIALWLVFALISGVWYALDPAAGGPLFSGPAHAVAAVDGAAVVPRTLGN
ncbi:MAG TPA: hypothetical protein VES73_00910 [Lamprocystis sp. (in: g-proteobacteria)]|nr:hypothetical protein [Lamprocystis sp. (in: g-proteobacteria)]